jgi:hypothetical protein
MDDNRRTALVSEYSEICNDFRMLTDIRFKLLAFLPIAAAAAAALNKEFEGMAEFTLSLFGLVVTIGLATYNERNNQLYDDLIGRAVTIERSLGLPDGAFANRPGSWLRIQLGGMKWKVSHSHAVNLIYASSAALWLFGVLSPLLQAANTLWVRAWPPIMSVENPILWIKGTALFIAICIVGYAMRSLSDKKEARENEMRDLARKLAKSARDKSWDELAKDTNGFLKDCTRLAGIGESEISKISRRFKFYRELIDPQSLGHYMHVEPPALKSAHLVALLTDLPPQWVFDCLTNRQGKLEDEPTVPAKVVQQSTGAGGP